MPNTIQTRMILQAVQLHRGLMSPVLLEHLLRGEVLGRMAEKGLLESPYLGALANLPAGSVFHLIEACLDAGWLARSEGFYPAVSVTRAGEDLLGAWLRSASIERSPEHAYRAYYRWRQGVARARRTPPYRILPNATLNELAMRRPVTLEELLAVPGLGKRRALRYHLELLAVGSDLRSNESPAELAGV